jgi:hypothetical protein
LIVSFNGIGPNYYSSSDGSFAQDVEGPPGISGLVTAIINGRSLTTLIANSLGSTVAVDLYDFFALNQGFDRPSSTGAFANVSQSLSCGAACIPFASLTAPSYRYVLGSADFGTDLYTFEGPGFPAAGTPTASFTGNQITFAFIPEPGSWLLFATGLLGLAAVARRRGA